MKPIRHVVVRLEGLLFSYRFNESELNAEFSQFGKVCEVMLLDEENAPDIAIIEFETSEAATAAVDTLDSTERTIEGYLGVTVRVALLTPDLERQLLVKAHILANSSSSQIDPFEYSAPHNKLICRYVVGADKMHSEYSVIGRLVGMGGENVKTIFRETGCYVKVNGKAKSVDDPLHVRVTADSKDSFAAGRAMTESLIQEMYNDYEKWCERNYLPVTPVRLIVVEGSDVLRPLSRLV
jgi:hypothetical protein